MAKSGFDALLLILVVAQCFDLGLSSRVAQKKRQSVALDDSLNDTLSTGRVCCCKNKRCTSRALSSNDATQWEIGAGVQCCKSYPKSKCAKWSGYNKKADAKWCEAPSTMPLTQPATTTPSTTTTPKPTPVAPKPEAKPTPEAKLSSDEDLDNVASLPAEEFDLQDQIQPPEDEEDLDNVEPLPVEEFDLQDQIQPLEDEEDLENIDIDALLPEPVDFTYGWASEPFLQEKKGMRRGKGKKLTWGQDPTEKPAHADFGSRFCCCQPTKCSQNQRDLKRLGVKGIFQWAIEDGKAVAFLDNNAAWKKYSSTTMFKCCKPVYGGCSSQYPNEDVDELCEPSKGTAIHLPSAGGTKIKTPPKQIKAPLVPTTPRKPNLNTGLQRLDPSKGKTKSSQKPKVLFPPTSAPGTQRKPLFDPSQLSKVKSQLRPKSSNGTQRKPLFDPSQLSKVKSQLRPKSSNPPAGHSAPSTQSKPLIVPSQLSKAISGLRSNARQPGEARPSPKPTPSNTTEAWNKSLLKRVQMFDPTMRARRPEDYPEDA